MHASTCGTVSRLCVRPCVAGLHSPWSQPLAPPAPRRIAPPCSPASQLLLLGPTSRVRSSSAIGFPSRCGPEAGLPWPNAGSPKFRRDPFARDLLFDPGRAGMASLSGPVHVAFDSLHGLRSCDVPITGLNHTPHATAVYASWPASPSAHATLASRLPAEHYLGSDFHRLIAPALLGAFAE